MTHSTILLNNGISHIRLNDGSGILLLNAEGGEHGIAIQNAHAISDLRGLGADKRRKRKTRISKATAQARIATLSASKTESLLLRQQLMKVESKIQKSNDLNIKSKIFDEYRTEFVDGKWEDFENEMSDKIKEGKLKKIRKLYYDYEGIYDE